MHKEKKLCEAYKHFQYLFVIPKLLLGCAITAVQCRYHHSSIRSGSSGTKLRAGCEILLQIKVNTWVFSPCWAPCCCPQLRNCEQRRLQQLISHPLQSGSKKGLGGKSVCLWLVKKDFPQKKLIHKENLTVTRLVVDSVTLNQASMSASNTCPCSAQVLGSVRKITR